MHQMRHLQEAPVTSDLLVIVVMVVSFIRTTLSTIVTLVDTVFVHLVFPLMYTDVVRLGKYWITIFFIHFMYLLFKHVYHLF
jgi:hypothetical protein